MKKSYWSYFLKEVNNNKLFLLLIFLLILTTYRGFPSSDNTDWWAQQKHIENPELFKNDWYITTTEEFDVRFYFNYLIVGLNYFINNMHITYFIYFLVSYAIFIYFLYLLCNLIFMDKKKSKFISIFIFLFGSSIFLTLFLLTRKDLSPQGISLALIMVSFFYYFKNNKFLAYTLSGLSLLFHPIQGIHFFGILFGTSLLWQILFKKFDIKEFYGVIPFILIALFFLVPTFLSGLYSAGMPSSLFLDLVKFRTPIQYFFSTWSFIELLGVMGLFFWFIFAFKNSKIDNNHKTTIKFFILIIFFYIFVGILFVEIIPIKYVLKLQLFRSSLFLYLFILIFIGENIYQGMLSKSFFTRIVYLILPVFFNFKTYIFTPIIFFFLRFYKKLYKCFISLSILLSLSLLFLFLSINLDLFDLFFSNFKAIILYLVMPWPILLVSRKIILLERKKKNYLLLFLFLLIFLFSLVNVTNILIFGNRESPNDSIFLFIKDNIPLDYILLTPPYDYSFRVYTNHGIVVDNKAYSFKEPYLLEWYNRIRNVSNKNKNLHVGYNSLSEGEIILLSKQYNFQYAVFENSKPLNFDKIFQSNKYTLYKIN